MVESSVGKTMVHVFLNRIQQTVSATREGVNREKLTVKKIINNEMFFFSPFMSLINREKSA